MVQLVDLLHLADTLVQALLGSEHADLGLHGLLHGKSDLSSALGAVGISDLVEDLDVLGTSIGGNRLQGGTGSEVVSDGVGDGTTEHNQIQEGVGAQSVSTVDRHTSSLTTREQTRDNLVLTVLINGKDLTSVSSRNTTHVVVDGGQDRNGLLANIDTSENTGGLGDTRKTLSKNLSRQVRELEEDVVLVSTNTTAIADLHGHRSGNDVARGKILGGGGITFHESLTLGVEEVTTLTTSTLSDQAAGTVDTSRVELDELEILVGQTSTGDHGHAVTSASVGGCAGEVGSAVTTSSEDSVVGEESVEGTVLLVVGKDTTALAILHNQI